MQTFEQWLSVRLTARGNYSAARDGTSARAIASAIMAFQHDNGLPLTGTANADTIAALRTDPPSSITKFQTVPALPAGPVWYREAGKLLGLKEVAGTKSNPTIISWAKALGGWISSYYTNDSIAWCGLFAAHCVGVTLPMEKLPDNPLGALNWKAFGKPLTVPALGAILVFTRPGSGLGHVTQYDGETSTHYKCRGGNQSDSVSDDDWILKTRCVAIRWPLTGEAPVGGRVMLDAKGNLVTAKED